MARGDLGITLVLVWLLPMSVGCGVQNAPGDRGVASHTGKVLQEVQEAHGGVARWKEFAGVRFSYKVRLGEDAPEWVLPEVAFWFDDFAHIFVVPREGAAPIRLDLSVGAPDFAVQLKELAGVGSGRVGEGPDAPASMAFALSSIRYLFLLPMATLEGQWEFRSIVPPGGLDTVPLLEVYPMESGAPVGPCLFDVDPKSLQLRQLVYGVPGMGRRAFKVTFRSYRKTKGISVATRRYHMALKKGDGDEEYADPFGIVTEEDLDRTFSFLIENVADVHLLAAEEMQLRYPRPGGEAAEDESSEIFESSGAHDSPGSGAP